MAARKSSKSRAVYPTTRPHAWLARTATFEIDRLLAVLWRIPETDNEAMVFAAKGLASRMARVNEIVRKVIDGELDEAALEKANALLRENRMTASVLDNQPWRWVGA